MERKETKVSEEVYERERREEGRKENELSVTGHPRQDRRSSLSIPSESGRLGSVRHDVDVLQSGVVLHEEGFWKFEGRRRSAEVETRRDQQE